MNVLVIEAMRKHPGDVAVQGHGCHALAVLFLSDECRASIVAADGVKAVVEAMCKHPGEVAVQGNGCRALGALATNIEEGRAKIVAGGGVEVVRGTVLGFSIGERQWGRRATAVRPSAAHGPEAFEVELKVRPCYDRARSTDQQFSQSVSRFSLGAPCS